MIRILMIMLFSLVGLAASAQGGTSIFEWKGREVVTKEAFRPLVKDSYKAYPNDPEAPVGTFYSYELKTPKGDIYTLRLQGTPPQDEHYYDGFTISYKGMCVLNYFTGDPLYDCRYLSLKKDNTYYLQVPLDASSFALILAGSFYGLDHAPEMVIVVVSDGKAKVVFDNYAFAYKYTPAPNFSMEYLDYVGGGLAPEQIMSSQSYRKNLRKHKIWREGNVLKYKSWK